MSYSGLGLTIGGKAGGSVSYGNGKIRTSGRAEGSAEGSIEPDGSTRKTYKPVTTFRATYKPPSKDEIASQGNRFPWLWVGVGTGILIVAAIAYAATR